MILLFGGTSDAAPIAQALADKKKDILVCTASNEPMAIGESERITRHCGRLTAQEMVNLIYDKAVSLIIDATHPYATEVSKQIQLASSKSETTVLTYIRPAAVRHGEKVHRVKDHLAAAKHAFSIGKPVLLTTGANNLLPYVELARACKQPIVARVLNRTESLVACEKARLGPSEIIAEKGPFTVEENIRHIHLANAGVMVVKDSGSRGGIESRLQAAEQAGCDVVMIERPTPIGENIFTDYESLVSKALL